jgi:hypothetical protein
VTFSASVPLSIPKYVTHFYTSGETFGFENILLGKSHGRAFSCRASSPCELLVLSSESFLQLGKTYPEFISELVSLSRNFRHLCILYNTPFPQQNSLAGQRIDYIKKAKRSIASILTANAETLSPPPATTATVYPHPSSVSIDVFPHIAVSSFF